MLCNLRRILASNLSDQWSPETILQSKINKIIHRKGKLMHCSRHWGIESCILLCLDYQYARKIRKQINFHWNNYEDNEERRKHVLQSPSLCLFTTILIHRDDDISVSKSISLQLLTCFCPINGFLSGMLSSVQSLSNVRLFATPRTAACQASVHHRLPEFTQAHVH